MTEGVASLDFLSGGGAMGRLIRTGPWESTPLGKLSEWPQGLRSAAGICIGSAFPIAIYWGPELVLLYNDAWSLIAGEKHPWALGRTAREVWPEIWDTIGPLCEHVLATGSATLSKDQLLSVRRHGYTEECYFDYTFTPIRGDTGRVEGIFNAVIETTERVVGERRQRTLRELAAALREARTPQGVCQKAAEVLGQAALDVPFAHCYLLSDDGLRLAASAGGPIDLPISAVLEQAVQDGRPSRIRLGVPVLQGPWPEPVAEIVLIPFDRVGHQKPHGVLVAGLSPRRAFDNEYRGFLDLVAGQITQGIANAKEYDAERRRAEALAEIDRARTAFFSDLSHEFRTPLTLMPAEAATWSFDDSAPAGPKGIRQRILLVDDNADMRDHVQRLLGEDYDVVAVPDGVAALREARAATPDLILSGVTMPGPDGFEFVREMRADKALREVPVIVLSARPGEEARVDGIGAGQFLTKPFSARELLARVETALSLSRVRREARRELDDAASRLHTALESARMVAFEWDLTNGRIVRSPNAPELLGLPVVSTIREGRMAVHPEDAPKLASVIDEAIARCENYSLQMRVVRPDTGETVWVETKAKVLCSDSGEPERIAGVLLDITARRRVEALIAGQKDALEKAVAGAPLREVIRVLLKTAESQCNQARAALFLCDPSAARLDFAVSDSMPEEFLRLLDGATDHSSSTANPSCAQAVSTGAMAVAYDIETDPLWASHRDLARRFGVRSCWSQPVRTSGGSVIGALALFHATPKDPDGPEVDALGYLAQTAAVLIQRDNEAAERQQMHVRLQQRTSQFEILLNQAPMGVYVIDADFRIKHINPTGREAFGDIPNLIGRDFEEVVRTVWPADYADEILRLFRRTLETGEPFVSPEQIELRADRQIRECYEWRIDRIPLTDGRFGVVCYFRDVSEQVRAREAIARSEERFRLMANQAPVLIWISGTDGLFQWFNDPWLRFSGRTMEQDLGEGWLELVHPADRARCRETHFRSFEARSEFAMEYRLRRHDGEWRWILDHGTPLLAGDTFSGYIGSCIDITDMKVAQEALRTRTEELETILNVVPVPVWIAKGDTGGDIQSNRAAAELGLDRIWESDSPNSALPIHRVLATGQPQVEDEIAMRTVDGLTVTLSGSAVPLLDGAGNVRGVVAAMVDITARKQWELQLSQSEERLRLAMETGRIGVWDWNLEDNQLTWSESLYGIHGLRHGEVPPTVEGFLDLVHPEDRATVAEAISRTVHSDAPYRLAFRALRPDGSVVWLFTNANVVRRGSHPVRMLGATLDVTEMKLAEEELRYANQDLEQFAYSASHDLREPLRSIKIYSELLVKRYAERLDGQALEALSFVANGASRMESLVRDLLAYTQATRLERPSETFDCDTPLSNALENLAGAIAESGADVSAKPLPAVRVRPTHLQQLFQNLIGNAIKYRKPDTRPEVRIAAQRIDQYWMFSVADNGIGIEPKYKERIFGLFKRLHTADRYSGTGIGLALCQRIVERYGGRIWVESEPEGGSTFYFTLPA